MPSNSQRIKLLLLTVLSVFLAEDHARGFGNAPSLEAPIRFTPGFKYSGEFVVDKAMNYDLALELTRTYKSGPGLTPPLDDFTVHFQISTQAGVVTEGNNNNSEYSPRVLAIRGNDQLRMLCTFRAAPHIKYRVFLKVTHVVPNATSSSPKLIIFHDPFHSRD